MSPKVDSHYKNYYYMYCYQLSNVRFNWFEFNGPRFVRLYSFPRKVARSLKYELIFSQTLQFVIRLVR